MAKLSQGILGGLRGKIGSVVGSSWKGIATLRAKALSISNPRTSLQVQQRKRFKTCVAMATVLLGPIIVPLWNRFAIKMSGYNSFVRDNLPAFAIEGELTPEFFHISKGKIAAPGIISVDHLMPSNTMNVSWDSSAILANQRATDIPFLVIGASDCTVFYAGEVNDNFSAGSCNVLLPQSATEYGQLYVFLAFRRVDGTMVSNTSFMSN